MLSLKSTAILMTDLVQITDAAKNLSQPLFILFTCLLFVSSSSAWGDFQNGIAAYNRDDYATAFLELKLLAELGHAEAQNKLGNMYETGKGLPKDYFAAYLWFHLAAIQGNDDARKNRDRVAANLTDNQIADAQYQADIRRLLKLQGVFDTIPKLLNDSQEDLFGRKMPEQHWKRFQVEYFLTPLSEILIRTYKNHLNQAEITQLIIFFCSPLGKKVAEFSRSLALIIIMGDETPDLEDEEIRSRGSQHFTEEELRGLDRFLASPVGREYLKFESHLMKAWKVFVNDLIDELNDSFLD